MEMRSRESRNQAAKWVRGTRVGSLVKARAAMVLRMPSATENVIPKSFGSSSQIVFEFQDDQLSVFYLLDIVNTGRAPVDTGGRARGRSAWMLYQDRGMRLSSNTYLVGALMDGLA